jgi:alpha-L-rhamnosidase
MSLFTGHVPEELQQSVLDNLVQNVQETRKGHLSTGIVGSYFLYEALARFGRPEIAYDVIAAQGYPGFEYMQSFQSYKQAPTTTLWEDWQANSSLCHPVQGCVVAFLYEFLAGIRPVPEQPGFKQFIVAPQIIRDLTNVTARLDTLYGTIRVKWQVAGQMFGLSLDVPPNTTAEVTLPCSNPTEILESGSPLEECLAAEILALNRSNMVLKVGSGSYAFLMPFRNQSK